MKKNKFNKIVILGSGPIVIGQACEFDYSGTQACKALKQKGYEIVLINSNPATIMTDPEMADKVYIEPLKFDFVKPILEKEKPDALISTLGGQTALNLSLELHEKGVLKDLGIKLLGANPEVIQKAEDRLKFNQILDSINAHYPQSVMLKNYKEGLKEIKNFNFPVILRPNYTLGGGGGGICYSLEEFEKNLLIALKESPTSEVLLEQSILGWNEFELEVMRDKKGSFVVICSIENLDPCGIHTGDSITVAPQQTLSDFEYQEMRDEAYKIIEKVGVETGGANIQFAVCPKTRKRVVIEMNPRVSRSSALASKATGFPIAKIAALLCVGELLEDIKNDITEKTISCYEPALDYVVTKVPVFNFHKFPGVKDELSTQMKSVGEVMGIGRSFKESLGKALLSLEENFDDQRKFNLDLGNFHSKRIFHIFEAFRRNMSVSEISHKTKIHPWFLEQIEERISLEKKIRKLQKISKKDLRQAKKFGFSDKQIASFLNKKESFILSMRQKFEIFPAYFQVDTCAGEFLSKTPYFYSTYYSKHTAFPMDEKLVVILGSGSNRIGQGIEFDYSCVRGVKKLQKSNKKVCMINSNPETVSTDYDTADVLFFEPLIKEYVLEVFRFIKPEAFIAQLGGQTSLNMASYLESKKYKMMGSSMKTIDLCEDREKFGKLCTSLGLNIPLSKMLYDLKTAISFSKKIGFPLICRPSYVLGGRRMEIIESEKDLEAYFLKYKDYFNEKKPLLMDQFLEKALEVDVDLVKGKNWAIIGGVLEHIERAGVHSGDSMGVLPPQKLKKKTLQKIEDLSLKLAKALNVKGLLNLQLAIQEDKIYVLEANPRGSRSLPFIAKSSKIPLVDLAVEAYLEKDKKQISQSYFKDWKKNRFISVKGVVFPFKKFKEADLLLGPEMKSTGESMGRGKTYAEALMKAFISSQHMWPKPGLVFLSLKDKDKKDFLEPLKILKKLNYEFVGTNKTALFLNENGFKCERVNKVHEGRPNCVDLIRSRKLQFVVNTTSGTTSMKASFGIRRSCLDYFVPCLTDIDTACAFCLALEKQTQKDFEVFHLA